MRHVIHRTINDLHPWTGKPIVRSEVACEMPVCRECQQDLRNGWSLHGLIAEYRSERIRINEVVEKVTIGVPTDLRYGIDVPVAEPMVLTGSPLSAQQIKEKLGQKVRIRNGKMS